MKSTFYKERETKAELCEFILRSDRLSMDVKCLEFEEAFSQYQGRKYSVFFNSGSSANLALICSLVNLNKIKQGDFVGFSALTWATNVMPLLQLNLNPIPLDVSIKTLNLHSTNLEKILDENRLDALFITNALGFCGDLDKIADICKDRDVLLLEDNCESLGSELKGKRLGNYGLASTFSFFVGHHLSTIEGGMVCTNDKELSNMLKMVRAHGWDRSLSTEEQSRLRKEWGINSFYDKYSFYSLAYNLRPTEIQGFLGLKQLEYLPEINKARNQNFREFNDVAQLNPDFEKLDVKHMDFVSNFAYPLICRDLDVFEKHRKEFKDAEVEIRPIIGGNILRQPFFRKYLKESGAYPECPYTDKVHELGFYFPNNPELTVEEKKTIKELLK